MPGRRLHIYLAPEAVERVDELRGLVSRSCWIRAAVERELQRLDLEEQRTATAFELAARSS